MKIQYEINGSKFFNKGMTIGELYTLSNTAQIDKTESVRYDSLDLAKQIKQCDLSGFSAITIFQWCDDTIVNVFFIK